MDWDTYLHSWEQEVFSLVPLLSSDYSEQYKAETLKAGLRKLPASADDIALATHVLGRAIPTELGEFYSASNGWNQVAFDARDLKILPVNELAPNTNGVDNRYLSDLKEYFTSGRSGNTTFRPENSTRFFLLSEANRDGCYLAVPHDTAPWEYGVIRFHSDETGFVSFAEMMRSERKLCTYFLRGRI